MIYLYGFIDDEAADLQRLRGFANEPLQSLSRGQVTAVFSVHRELALRPDVASLRLHDEVVTALMDRCTVAPARFGSVLAYPDQLDDLLADKGPWLCPVLLRLKGMRELSVRATIPEGGDRYARTGEWARPAPDGSGRAYLLGLYRDHRCRTGIAHPSFERLHQALAVRARAWTVREEPGHSMAGAYLVAVDDTEAFREALVVARADQPHLRVSLTGPWAAYSFVEPEAPVDA